MTETIVNEASLRCLGRAELAQALQASRQRTLALFAASEAALGPSLAVPWRPELNPPLWELGHVGWFADWWIARNPQRALGLLADPAAERLSARQRARGQDADALYNSSEVPHDSRWHLPLPDASATRRDLADSLRDTLALLERAEDSDAGLYFFRLALVHEDMHAEAAVYMAQTLGFDPQDAPTARRLDAPAHPPRLLDVPAAAVHLGHSGPGFAFDNELQPQTTSVRGFSIDAQPVSWARYLPFVESGGYAERRFWSDAGWAWRMGAERTGLDPPAETGRPAGPWQAPRHLCHTASGWQQQRWGRWQALPLPAPACHLTLFEAQAWCAWAGRRLPSEAEWVAASQQPEFEWGQVWEWTASPFAPFPGFQAHPYRDYSQPWFDGRPVLKGASAATDPRMVHRQYRNFFPPGRNDIFSGFRSVALASEPPR